MANETANLHKKLMIIQAELKAPKGQENSFGHYKYRSCEDILEAVKPLLQKNDTKLVIYDELQNIGDRYYVKATAELSHGTGDKILVSAYAREEETKKGMDASQITGAASSYARKYALNGLFLIDDTKDADSMDNSKSVKSTSTNKEAHSFGISNEKPRYITAKQVELLINKTKWGLKTWDKDEIVGFINQNVGKEFTELTKDEFDEALINLDKAIKSNQVATVVEANKPFEEPDTDGLDQAAVKEALDNDMAGLPY